MNPPEDDDPDPKERGVDAVEKRIEKVMADMRDQALIDVNDEKAYHAKKVSYILNSVCTVTLSLLLGCSIS